MFLTEKNKLAFLILIIISIGIFLRLIQINFEDYWLDEMASFWFADPNISFEGTLDRNYNVGSSATGQAPPLFDLILKKYFKIFGYEPQIGRQLPFIFGILSLPIIGVLSHQVKNHRSYLFTLFLVSTNFYLITYSQETRPYIFVFLLSILNIIFYYNLNLQHNFLFKKFFFLFLFVTISVVTYSSHPFTLIIFFSQIFHMIYVRFFFKENSYLFFISLPFTLIIYLWFNFDYLVAQLSFDEYFLSQENWKFYYNYYFSRFFGSKIMGSIYLSSLIYLIISFRKKIFYEKNNYLFLIILFIFSYLIPLLYGFIKTPVLTDRYIIFVLIPIFILISCLTFEIQNKFKKIFLLIYILVPTIINNYIEINNRKITKPEFTKFFTNIKEQKVNVNNFIILGPDIQSMLVKNYIKNLKEFDKSKYKIHDEINMTGNTKLIWMLCYEPINGFDCSISEITENKVTLIDEKQYHLLNSKLYKINY